jgi:teichoic acid transport system permease protein
MNENQQNSEPTHIFQSNAIGLPHLSTYFRELWRRREFAVEMSKSTLRVQQAVTTIGKFWIVLNPLLLATVYFFLVNVLSGKSQGAEYFTHLLAGLFAFYFVSGCMSNGATSIVSAGKLVTNTSFPKLLLPLAAVRTAFTRFVPTLVIFLVLFVVGGSTFSPNQFLAIPAFLLILVFGAGLAAFFAALQVYFRDTTSFLPYLTRIWLYISPILYYPEEMKSTLGFFAYLNPLYSLLGLWTESIVEGKVPPMTMWVVGLFWAAFSIILGFWFFISREREFSVRL